MTKKALYVDDLAPVASLGYGYTRSAKVVEGIIREGFCVDVFATHDQPDAAESFCLPGASLIRANQSDSTLASMALPNRLREYDLIWISRIKNLRRCLPQIEQRAHQAKVVYDAEALTAVRERHRQALLTSKSNHLAIDLHDEIAYMDVADEIVSVSEKEAQLIETQLHRAPLVLGHPIPVTPTRKSQSERSGILFIGSFLNLQDISPNADAISHFCHNVLPLIRLSTDVHVKIAGYGSEVLPSYLGWGAAKDIEVLGTISGALTELYDEARIVVVPTRFAAGIPWKVHEALAHGVPLVVTRLISDQLGEEGAFLPAAKNDEEFADLALTLLTNEAIWRRVRKRGMEYVRTACCPKRFQEKLREACRL